ncbi:unnamed protein product [Caenorhabditis bovis]|uniref:Palmitoyltransferase n=1 Tax=Caenorhabditis bovis TaxID=2654633 RepID=A0A8S1F2F6_9PELO|nr:unnamed protein product [Caenorhabditis bovis]
MPTTSSQDPEAANEPQKNSRKWTVHQGRNRFCCQGRMVCSRQHGVFVLTVFLLSTCLTLFFIFDAPFMWNINPAIPIVAAVLSTSVIANFVLTSFSDPGIIPRVGNLELIELDKQKTAEQIAENCTNRVRTKEVVVNGQRVKLKYCTTCRMFRPPRTSHCSVCDNCVMMFDHHCPWVGNCIGQRNYAFFYRFVISLAFLIIYCFACSVVHLCLVSKQKESLADAIKQNPITLVVALVGFFSIWSVVGLMCFHSYLIVTNQTTNEDLKGVYRNKPSNPPETEVKNPFHRGFFKNIAEKLCRSQPPSVLDASGFLDANVYIVVPKPKASSSSHEPTTST